ncbi:MAG: hypothetical protein J6I49_07500 [Bacteroidales bacterium]|nr:hypothetical protein [Bacteroidales bacterium]
MTPETSTLLSCSLDMRKEYCAKIIRIGDLFPIEDADRLERTNLDGHSVVVEKGRYHPGEAVIYCTHESQINRNFLAANNQFSFSERRLNANHAEVAALIAEGRDEEARRLTGHFNRQGRVRMVRFRGCPSYGCVLKAEQLARWNPRLEGLCLEDYLTVDEEGREHPFRFDTVDGKIFIQAYYPRFSRKLNKNASRHNRRLARFDRLEPGQFLYHYETDTLNGNIWRLKPDTTVAISLKMHGTSVCLAHVLTRTPVRLTVADRMTNRRILRRMDSLRREATRFPWQRKQQECELERLEHCLIQPYRLCYGPVWSSRSTIKNRYINTSVSNGFYEVDLWSQYGELLHPFLDPGMTLYGEICGYLTQLDRMIMKNYDYGCQRGENFLMPYRITHTAPDGTKTEWSVMQVHDWTQRLIERQPELAACLRPIHILYHGTLRDLYPSLDTKHFWSESLLEALKADTEHFGMEQDEPLCRHRVPREGICIRIDGDPEPQCFKLKTTAFFNRETKLIDEGKMDYEMEVQLNAEP